ncbi:response regulator [Paludisphaera soli]|uniref:response regulator n=1 Tax=Paludisphaera soli TaxID=2712865 RepID=UPI0013EB956D|nr:response regulator [Paludisphaera soli]
MTESSTDRVYFLLVDDLEENLVALAALLRRDGLELLTARSGPEALELLLKHEVALALIDVQMPGMDGFELAELMRGAERTRRVPIIFLTAGNTDQRRRFRGYEAGAVDFLGKPLEPDVLRSKVEVFFQLARQRDELKAALAENARLLEETRRHAAALKETDRLKDEFLAMLAHELRNPLSAVASAVQLWKMSGSAAHHDWAKQVIENQMKTFSRLIDDLLDVSRINHGKIRVKKQVLDPGPILQQAVTSVAPLVRERRHELSVDLGHGSATVDVDPTRLEQVIVNLLNNAAKYSEDEARIHLSTTVAGGRLAIAVKDSGIGIPPDQLPRMFELFAQGDRSMSRSEGGLGIGLTLVKSLVELHGGSVAAESLGIGHGSTFTVSLPIANAEARAAEEAARVATGSESATAKLLILVVDDCTDAALAMSRLLQLLGHEVVVAHEGRTAVRLAEERRPDALILDIGLPGMTGYEVAQRLRQNPATRAIKLIAVTGYGQDKDRARAIEAGFDHHMIKPIDIDQLMELLNGTRPLDRESQEG